MGRFKKAGELAGLLAFRGPALNRGAVLAVECRTRVFPDSADEMRATGLITGKRLCRAAIAFELVPDTGRPAIDGPKVLRTVRGDVSPDWLMGTTKFQMGAKPDGDYCNNSLNRSLAACGKYHRAAERSLAAVPRRGDTRGISQFH
jgi:hypothetical protein